MLTRSRLLALLAVIGFAAVAAPQLATGAKNKSRAIEGQARLAMLETSGKLQPFKFSGAGTNYVDIGTGEVFKEVWKGLVTKPRLGRLTTRVAGWIELTGTTSFTFRGSFVAAFTKGDVMIGTCHGAATVPAPEGDAKWFCEPTGGTGRFEHSRGRWTVRVHIVKVWLHGNTQKNRFSLTGDGRLG